MSHTYIISSTRCSVVSCSGKGVWVRIGRTVFKFHPWQLSRSHFICKGNTSQKVSICHTCLLPGPTARWLAGAQQAAGPPGPGPSCSRGTSLAGGQGASCGHGGSSPRLPNPGLRGRDGPLASAAGALKSWASWEHRKQRKSNQCIFAECLVPCKFARWPWGRNSFYLGSIQKRNIKVSKAILRWGIFSHFSWTELRWPNCLTREGKIIHQISF